MASEKILGIDLGTTNSAFAVMEGGDPEIIVNGEGDRTTPSVVAFDDDSERLIGKPAKNQAVQNPDKTIQSIKRHMGEEDYEVEIDDETYTPEQISAMVLQKIKRDAEEYLGHDVEKAVITVPAYFNDRQRQATKNAGEIAGFEVERIVNEPTAASMAYGLDDESDQTVLVYDLGGGTFDVSVLELGGGVYDVVATNGDNDLGGDDWDEAIIDHLADEFADDVDDIVLLDVTPLSLGIEVKGGIFERLIEKNTTIPTDASKVFTTAADNQTSVQVRVFQGEREIAEENELLGEFMLSGIPPAPAGTPQIEVEFSIDADGIVNVSAEDQGSGNAESITIEGGAGLSDEEVERMQEEAEQHAEEDQKRRERIEARNEAEGAVQRAESLLEENEEQVDDDLEADIQDAIEEVEAVLEDDDAETEELQDVTENLSTELQEIGKQMYEQQAQQAQAGPGGAGGPEGGFGPNGAGAGGAAGADGEGDEYVDADFEDADEDDEKDE